MKMNCIKKGKCTVLLPFVTVLILLIVWIAYGNTNLEINQYSIESKRIPSEFDNFRIAQVSDLHNSEFGKDNVKLISLLKSTDADIIAVTGDIIDSFDTNVDISLDFVREAVKIAPVYYVNGNHEANVPDDYKTLRDGFAEAGVVILENSSADITVGDETITIIGINDPVLSVHSNAEQSNVLKLEDIVPDNDNYKILLAHRPEYFGIYAGKVDLVLSGHAHGGQFILPFVGGIVAPGQGFMPEYYEGSYIKEKTEMIVSRGIGNSIIPFRINNNPEIVVVELAASF